VGEPNMAQPFLAGVCKATAITLSTTS